MQALVGRTIAELVAGTEQLVFSFLVPSTLSHTNNIQDMQNLVSEGKSVRGMGHRYKSDNIKKLKVCL